LRRQAWGEKFRNMGVSVLTLRISQPILEEVIGKQVGTHFSNGLSGDRQKRARDRSTVRGRPQPVISLTKIKNGTKHGKRYYSRRNGEKKKVASHSRQGLQTN